MQPSIPMIARYVTAIAQLAEANMSYKQDDPVRVGGVTERHTSTGRVSGSSH